MEIKDCMNKLGVLGGMGLTRWIVLTYLIEILWYKILFKKLTYFIRINYDWSKQKTQNK